MEGAHLRAQGAAAKETPGPLTHLCRGLVGEGHGDDAVRPNIPFLHIPGNPVRQHARLAAARAGHYQQGSWRRGNGAALLFVQSA